MGVPCEDSGCGEEQHHQGQQHHPGQWRHQEQQEEEHLRPPLCFSMAAVIVDDIIICREPGVTRSPSGMPPDRVQHASHTNDMFTQALGGGNTFACNGMAIMCDHLQLPQTAAMVARVGRDILTDVDFLNRMRELHIDTAGVTILDIPNPRGRLVSYMDGTRNFAMMDTATYRDRFRPTVADVPDHYIGASGVHLLAAPQRAADIVTNLRRRGFRGLALLEPSPRVSAGDLPAMRALSPSFHVYSPNVHEARRLLSAPPDMPAVAVTRQLLGELACPVVVVRCGEDGCIVAARTWAASIPTVDTARFVNDTGCGNTFCGTFLAALCQPCCDSRDGAGDDDDDDNALDDGAVLGQRNGDDGGVEGAARQQQQRQAGGQGVGSGDVEPEQVASWVHGVLHDRDRLLFAALHGTVAASFTLESEGLPGTVDRDEHTARFTRLSTRVTPL
ncbi:hypothetical protein PTSG_12217 [Salpingoeca rosetta]|uniref:Carbohydrate kinase PfkB domain-containing protein n=1 Tax=Salpingoeca rosetta (strain ATCC 50818 / BSB-021) TaxID=946362 RepID=F2U9S8_SALR5|nr:uncharacterized protein PTSG_12217 [Salpingoeca rosetta]EGD73105.1 hypothetical protein PTSG_12217 [Salpingoeca rosetta]|eukprot:XP_004994136.1 hypothetical protein PTSG_12217 [Salpingoeca rosetta]